MTLRTIVVDDSILFRKTIRDCLSEFDRVQVIDHASDGHQAVEKILRHQPDLVTLDYEMPHMNGIEVLRELRRNGCQSRVILVSSLADDSSPMLSQAISLGAFDFILKPTAKDSADGLAQLRAQFLEKVAPLTKLADSRDATSQANGSQAVGTRSQGSRSQGSRSQGSWATPNKMAADQSSVDGKTSPGGLVTDPFSAGLSSRCNSLATTIPQDERTANGDRRGDRARLSDAQAIVIGVSTGGPAALTTILPQLKSSFALPIFLVQHMPTGFTASLSQHLDKISRIPICEASEGMIARPGEVYIAPGGRHMRVRGNCTNMSIRIGDEDPVKNCRPSIDVMMKSVTQCLGNRYLALILTGMGDDGLDGCRRHHANGGIIWTQDRESCTVFGMPRSISDAGLSDRSISLQQVASELNSLSTIGPSVLC